MRKLLLGAALAVAFSSAAFAQTVSLTITQNVVTLTAGTDSVIAPGSNARRYLCLMNLGLGQVTLAFDTPAVAGNGWALDPPAATQGNQGGAQCFETGIPRNVVHAISTAGAKVAVLTGQ